jgi:hypothetical protein
VKALRDLFNNIQINNYWETHYQFDKESKPSWQTFGAASVDTILLNTVALFLFSYGRHLQQQYYISRSLKLLENIPGEQNSIMTDFANLGLKINTAFESQALLELKNNYCDYKKCLQCGVGIKILKPA